MIFPPVENKKSISILAPKKLASLSGGMGEKIEAECDTRALTL